MFVLCRRCSIMFTSFIFFNAGVSSIVFFLHSLLQVTWPRPGFSRQQSPPHFPFLRRLCNLFHSKDEKSPGNWSLLGMSHWDTKIPRFWFIVYMKEKLKRFPEDQQWKVTYRVAFQYTQCYSLWNIQLRQWLGLSESWARWPGWSEAKISSDTTARILHRIENPLLCAGIKSGMSHLYQDACRMIFISLYAYKGV